MVTLQNILSDSGLIYQRYAAAKAVCVYLTKANQLIGSYNDLKRFQSSNPDYLGWQAHHIVEFQDLQRLGVMQHAGPRGQQLCVLLPASAHIGRINSILRMENPANHSASTAELKLAYGNAYALMGNYCGGGERQVRAELMAVVAATFRKFCL